MGLRLTLACGDYDRTWALQDGAVVPEGIDLQYVALDPPVIFRRMLERGEWDASEMSFASYLITRGRGEDRFMAIPVFPSRVFRHSAVFIHEDSGIKAPQDLAGKHVGLPEYAMTAAVWVRGLLQHEYGVGPGQIRWLIGGLETPAPEEKIRFSLPPGVRLDSIPAGKTLSGMLEQGELDALVSVKLPSPVARRSPKVRRLFPDYQAAELDYYRKTGLFPIMHTVVLRQDVYEAHPWVAMSLYKAFVRAKAAAEARLTDTDAVRYMLPWMVAEAEELRVLSGGTWWPYGVEGNRKALETLVQYMVEQGLMPAPLKPEQLFAPATLDEFRI